MALLPAGDTRGFAAIPSLDPHVLHARRALENLNDAEGQVLIERVLGNDIHEERHRLEVLPLRYLLRIQSRF